MTDKFIAAAITRTQNAADTERIEITFADAKGNLHTVSITAATACSLSSTLGDFAVTSRFDGAVATKMPREFAVGSGRFEQVVLVRFEDDIPYGLQAVQAAQLGRALVEQAKIISCQPVPHRQ